MKAIVTKYIGPTNYRGSRIKAYAEGVKPLTISRNSEARNPHREAAEQLAKRHGWNHVLVEGGMPDGAQSVFVMLPDWCIEGWTKEQRLAMETL